MEAVSLFNLHEDIRHVVVVDSAGNVEGIRSRAKATWPEEQIKQFSGLMAAIIFGICEKVQSVAGTLDYIQVSYEKMKVFIVRGRENKFYIISARKKIPQDIVNQMVEKIKTF